MRKKKGIHAAELCVGAIVLIPLVLYGIDAIVMYFGASKNATVCRDACRAAAAAPPSPFCAQGTNDPYRPKKRAEAVVAKAVEPGSIIRMSPTVLICEEIDDPRPIQPWGGPVHGRIRLRTSVLVDPPFKLPFMPPEVSMMTEQAFPITWVMPPNYRVAASGSGGSTTTGGTTTTGGPTTTGGASTDGGGDDGGPEPTGGGYHAGENDF